MALFVHAGQPGLSGAVAGGMFRRGQSGGRSPGPPLDGCLQAGADGQPDHDHAQAGGGSESSARTSGSDDFHVFPFFNHLSNIIYTD